MWRNEDKEYISTECLLDLIEQSAAGIIVIDGPSACGKTTIVRSIDSPSKLIVSSEFVDQCLAELEGSDISDLPGIILEKLSGYSIVCFEDIDMMLNGKEATTVLIADAVNRISESCVVVITGIELKKRVPLLFELMKANLYYYNDTLRERSIEFMRYMHKLSFSMHGRDEFIMLAHNTPDDKLLELMESLIDIIAHCQTEEEFLDRIKTFDGYEYVPET